MNIPGMGGLVCGTGTPQTGTCRATLYQVPRPALSVRFCMSSVSARFSLGLYISYWSVTECPRSVEKVDFLGEYILMLRCIRVGISGPFGPAPLSRSLA